MATKLDGKKCFVIMPFGQKMDINGKLIKSKINKVFFLAYTEQDLQICLSKLDRDLPA